MNYVYNLQAAIPFIELAMLRKPLLNMLKSEVSSSARASETNIPEVIGCRTIATAIAISPIKTALGVVSIFSLHSSVLSCNLGALPTPRLNIISATCTDNDRASMIGT